MAHLAEPTPKHAAHIAIPKNADDPEGTTAKDAVIEAARSEPTIQELYSLKGRSAIGVCTLSAAL